MNRKIKTSIIILLSFLSIIINAAPIMPITNGKLTTALDGNQQAVNSLFSIQTTGTGPTAFTFEDGSGTETGGITNSTVCSSNIINKHGIASYISPSLASPISATTNFVADFSNPATFVSMATVAANVNFIYTTNWVNDTNFQRGFMLILGDGTHSLSFNVPGGENIWTPTNSITTNGTVPALNKLYKLEFWRLKVPTVITSTGYELTAPNQ